MNDLAIAARIGLGFTPAELTQIQHQIDESVRVQSARVGEAAAAKGEAAAEKAVWKAGLIGGAIGIVGGGLLGLALALKFR